MLRLDMNLVWTILNVIILYLLLKKFLIKPVLSVMNQREQMIQQSIGRARSQEAEAGELKEQYERALASAKEESQVILEKARTNAQKESARILQEADEQVKRLEEKSRQEMELGREKEMQKMQNEVAGLALTAVSRILEEGSDAGSDSALYNQFLKKAGESHGKNR